MHSISEQGSSDSEEQDENEIDSKDDNNESVDDIDIEYEEDSVDRSNQSSYCQNSHTPSI